MKWKCSNTTRTVFLCSSYHSRLLVRKSILSSSLLLLDFDLREVSPLAHLKLLNLVPRVLSGVLHVLDPFVNVQVERSGMRKDENLQPSISFNTTLHFNWKPLEFILPTILPAPISPFTYLYSNLLERER